MTDQEFNDMLIESGVANDAGHYENQLLHTAITSREELRELVDMAYESGFDDAAYDAAPINGR